MKCSQSRATSSVAKNIMTFAGWPIHCLQIGTTTTFRINVICPKVGLHQAGPSPGFRRMKQLGVILLPHGWDASSSQGHWYLFIHLGGEGHCKSCVFCPRTQDTALEKAWTQATWSGAQRQLWRPWGHHASLTCLLVFWQASKCMMPLPTCHVGKWKPKLWLTSWEPSNNSFTQLVLL